MEPSSAPRRVGRSGAMSFSAIIVAAGTGSRAGEAKQWRRLGGRPVLRWSAEALLAAGASELAVVVAPGAEALARKALTGLEGWFTVDGGDTRAASVQAGLGALAAGADARVLIHDAARPSSMPRPFTGCSGRSTTMKPPSPSFRWPIVCVAARTGSWARPLIGPTSGGPRHPRASDWKPSAAPTRPGRTGHLRQTTSKSSVRREASSPWWPAIRGL